MGVREAMCLGRQRSEWLQRTLVVRLDNEPLDTNGTAVRRGGSRTLFISVHRAPPPKLSRRSHSAPFLRTVECNGGWERPSGNGPVDKRTVKGHIAVITLPCRHISHQSSGTGFRIRRFDAL
jgi:hypothetical protein